MILKNRSQSDKYWITNLFNKYLKNDSNYKKNCRIYHLPKYISFKQIQINLYITLACPIFILLKSLFFLNFQNKDVTFNYKKTYDIIVHLNTIKFISVYFRIKILNFKN